MNDKKIENGANGFRKLLYEVFRQAPFLVAFIGGLLFGLRLSLK